MPLTELGRRQIAATAQEVSANWRSTAVYTSPLQRARDTANAIATACGAHCEVLPDLTDIDYGAWQGRTHEEIEKSEPDLYARWFNAPQLMRFPGGEALQDVMARTARALFELMVRHAGESIVLVSHDSTGRALLLQLLDQPASAYWRLTLSPCGISVIELDGRRANVMAINQTTHLRAC